MKIYTKSGDQGLTSLIGGTRVYKSHIRIDAYGTIDELNSYVGLLRDQPANTIRQSFLIEIQNRLFIIGALLAADPEKNKMKLPEIAEEDVVLLETEIDKMDELLPEMRFFILPGGHQSVSFCHIARTVCRRAERLIIALNEETESVDELIIKYINRLSDYLFVLSRLMGQELSIEEIPWKSGR